MSKANAETNRRMKPHFFVGKAGMIAVAQTPIRDRDRDRRYILAIPLDGENRSMSRRTEFCMYPGAHIDENKNKV